MRVLHGTTVRTLTWPTTKMTRLFWSTDGCTSKRCTLCASLPRLCQKCACMCVVCVGVWLRGGRFEVGGLIQAGGMKHALTLTFPHPTIHPPTYTHIRTAIFWEMLAVPMNCCPSNVSIEVSRYGVRRMKGRGGVGLSRVPGPLPHLPRRADPTGAEGNKQASCRTHIEGPEAGDVAVEGAVVVLHEGPCDLLCRHGSFCVPAPAAAPAPADKKGRVVIADDRPVSHSIHQPASHDRMQRHREEDGRPALGPHTPYACSYTRTHFPHTHLCSCFLAKGRPSCVGAGKGERGLLGQSSKRSRGGAFR